MTEQSGQRNDSNSVHGKDNARRHAGTFDGNADGHEDQKNIEYAGEEDIFYCQEETHDNVLVLDWCSCSLGWRDLSGLCLGLDGGIRDSTGSSRGCDCCDRDSFGIGNPR
jgi:hypothetical protein